MSKQSKDPFPITDVYKERKKLKNICLNYCGVFESFRTRIALEIETFAIQFLLLLFQHFLPTLPRSKASKFQFAKSANSPNHSYSNQSPSLIYPRMEKWIWLGKGCQIDRTRKPLRQIPLMSTAQKIEALARTSRDY